MDNGTIHGLSLAGCAEDMTLAIAAPTYKEGERAVGKAATEPCTSLTSQHTVKSTMAPGITTTESQTTENVTKPSGLKGDVR